MSQNKKVDLAKVFKENEGHQNTNTTNPTEPIPVNENIAPSRRGKKNISGYFAPEVHRQLRVIAAEEDKNLQEVLGDALNTFFERKGKPPIA
ncbi:hypothetical protein F4212_06615 [Candidatus Poribacteria bacterium]|nr:hypothetical protein [Candidatus Poribacteria bacterium]